MTTLPQNQNNEKGFSLLELLLVVAVGAVLILAGLAAYRLVTENNNVNEAIRALNTLKQQTQRAFQSEGQYPTGADTVRDVLRDLRAIPSDLMINDAGDMRHPFGGAITIVGAGDEFTITFADVGRSACIQIGQAFEESTDSDFAGLTIGTNAITTSDGVTIAELSGANACPADGATADMIWAFF